RGMLDRRASPDAVLAHCRWLVSAGDSPVSADLGNCFGDEPSSGGETFSLAVRTGLSGASVEDMKDDYTIYDHGLARDRVQAAAEAAHAQPFPFTLTARAENFLVGRRDLGDTIARLQAYERAGADVLYAPGLTTREEIGAVVSALSRPVNVIAGIAGLTLTFDEMQALGVKRISTGSTLARVAITAFIEAAKEMRERGTFTFGEQSMTFREINSMFDG